MSEHYNLQIQQARDLLRHVSFAAMATVNHDGSPHNTPYFFMYNKALTQLYWGSHPDSLHSQNILRDGRLFVVLYNSVAYDGTGNKGGLYITAANARIATDSEFEPALAAHNQARERVGKKPIAKEIYDTGPQKMWVADITKLEIYYQERDPKTGYIIWEPRKEVTAQDLLKESL